MSLYFLAVYNPDNARQHCIDNVDGWYLIKIDKSAKPVNGATWWTTSLGHMHTYIDRRMRRASKHAKPFEYLILEVDP